jgi:hypothetical protein
VDDASAGDGSGVPAQPTISRSNGRRTKRFTDEPR